jgi:hypothetical protein
MIWGILWALGVIVGIAFVLSRFGLSLRGALRWVIFSVLGGVAFIVVAAATLFFQGSYLEPHPGYRAFVEAAARISPRVSIFAAIVLVLDIVPMAIYTIRQGKTDIRKGTVIADGPLPGLSVNPLGRSKRKILASKNKFITMESLLKGTATFGERMMVLGIFILYISFFFIFVGGALITMKEWLIVAILFVVVPGLWVYAALIHPVWRDYREVKAKLRKSGAKKLG